MAMHGQAKLAPKYTQIPGRASGSFQKHLTGLTRLSWAISSDLAGAFPRFLLLLTIRKIELDWPRGDLSCWIFRDPGSLLWCRFPRGRYICQRIRWHMQQLHEKWRFYKWENWQKSPSRGHPWGARFPRLARAPIQPTASARYTPTKPLTKPGISADVQYAPSAPYGCACCMLKIEGAFAILTSSEIHGSYR